MERNWDCIRAILIALEDQPDTAGLVRPDDLPAWNPETVSYNMLQLAHGGFIEARDQGKPGRALYCVAIRLTWEGHELLDRIRTDTAWKRVRKIAHDRSIDLSFEVVKSIATMCLQQMLGGSS